MNTAHQPQPLHCAPFVPVLKGDAAKILQVCSKTIDNYIAQGLLPKPKRFGMREMWHPDVFYAHLGGALLGEGPPGDDGMALEPVEAATTRPAPEPALKQRETMPKRVGAMKQRLAEINQRHAA